jgi:hypothetical protein
MASPPNFRFSPGIPPGTIDLFLLIFKNIFLITLVLIINVSKQSANCILKEVTIAAKD